MTGARVNLIRRQGKDGRTERLAPCPFCGGTNVFLRDEHYPHVWIECADCRIGTLGNDPAVDPLNTIYARWNRRAPPPDVTEAEVDAAYTAFWPKNPDASSVKDGIRAALRAAKATREGRA